MKTCKSNKSSEPIAANPSIPSTSSASAGHAFAWDGVAFPVPANWNLASFRADRRTLRAVLEDDTAVRLEIEWEDTGRASPPLAHLADRLAHRLRRLRPFTRVQELDAFPAHWRAQVCDFSDGRRLVAAVGLIPGVNRSALLRFHFDAVRPGDLDLARQVLDGARFDAPDARLWQVYDCAFRVHAAWRLRAADFAAGRKHFEFVWRRRRLLLWFVSFADIALRSQTLAQWGADFLNRQPTLPGPRFRADGQDRLAAARRALPHYTELLRGCRRYHTRLRRIPERNQIAVVVFQHRGDTDLRLVSHFEEFLY